MIRRLIEPPYLGLLWLLCLIVLLGLHPNDWADSVRVLPSPQSALLAPDATWHPPISRWMAASDLGELPLVIVAGLLAAVITFVCQPARLPLGLERIGAAVGLSVAVRLTDFVAALILCLSAIGIRMNSADRRRVGTALLFASAILSLLGTLEFGLIVVVAGGLLMSIAFNSAGERPLSRNTSTWAVVLFATAITAWLILDSGFRDAALRPASWCWLQPPVDLLPSLSASLSTPPWLAAIGLILPFWCLGWLTLLRNRASVWLIIPWLGCVLLAANCHRYHFLAGLATAVPLVQYPNMQFTLGRPRVIISLFLAVAVVYASLVTDWSAFASGLASPQVVQPAEWRIRGPVVLLNLDQSLDWRAREGSDQLPLLVDDRWDALGNIYPEFAALRRDLQEVRDHPYLRDDGEWGGYRPWMQEIAPTLLVVDSHSVVAIRALTLSPDWRVMGIDGDFTIFGRADDRGNFPQMQRALDGLLNLEWPARPIADSLDNTIVAANNADDRTIAGVLCAMRFPYAGLRFLQGDVSDSATRVRTWCYLELAHRVAQHSSTPSLLDQHRAVIHARRMLAESRLGADERIRMTRSLESLGVSIDGTVTEGDNVVEIEQRLRSALLRGDTFTAREMLGEVDPARTPFYRVLIASPETPSLELVAALQSVVAGMGDNLPAELKSEAEFYLGCAALESGDTLTALTAFIESEATAPDSPYREIRGVYLRQLTR